VDNVRFRARFGVEGETPLSGEVGEITGLLDRVSAGDTEAEGRLFDLIYRELHDEARRQMNRQKADHTLRTTALVHEAYLRLARLEDVRWDNRRHFLAVAARAMRSVLVDHARKRGAAKRGAGKVGRPLDEVVLAFEERSADLLALDAALERLAGGDEAAAKVVELRFFGGFAMSEVARILGISLRQAERRWSFARAWLRKELA